MNLIRLNQDLTIDESRETHAYADPLTGGAPWTCGIGCTKGVTKDTVWNDAQIDAHYDDAVKDAIAGLDRICPWWRGLDSVRQNCLLNMIYNLGPEKLRKFRKMLRACAVGDYDTASAEMLDSAWSKQVGNRAKRLAEEMRTGVWK